jgi:2-phospho-L-lactate guanylyltransferase
MDPFQRPAAGEPPPAGTNAEPPAGSDAEPAGSDAEPAGSDAEPPPWSGVAPPHAPGSTPPAPGSGVGPGRPSPAARAQQGWAVVLPVKGGPAAKSRLGGPAELAAAIVRDCLDAVTACPEVARVVVVTSDPVMARMAREVTADVVSERRPGAGLVEAVRDGVRAAGNRPGPVAVLLPDVPAARAEDLGQALQAVRAALTARPASAMAVVPDADGTGSVLLAARSAEALDPAFGPGSAAEHTRRGAVRLDLDLPRLRRDVDTPADLCAVLDLGAGPRTVRAAIGHPVSSGARRQGPKPRAGRRPPATLSAVQATVYRFDPATGSGSVLTDAGLVLPFDAEAFATSGLRLLHPGQRLGVTVAGEGAVTVVTSLWLESVGLAPTRPYRP